MTRSDKSTWRWRIEAATWLWWRAVMPGAEDGQLPTAHTVLRRLARESGDAGKNLDRFLALDGGGARGRLSEEMRLNLEAAVCAGFDPTMPAKYREYGRPVNSRMSIDLSEPKHASILTAFAALCDPRMLERLVAERTDLVRLLGPVPNPEDERSGASGPASAVFDDSPALAAAERRLREELLERLASATAGSPSPVRRRNTMTDDLHICSLDTLDSDTVHQFGGKAANLGELVSAGMKVPPGVALGKDVFALFLRENGIDLAELERIHSLGMTFLESALAAARDAQVEIVRTIRTAAFPNAVTERLTEVLGTLLDARVAVRSSCVVEDSASVSFAGQYVTVLNVQGMGDILNAIRDCWASQYDGKVLSYAIARRGMPVLNPSMAVVIQRMLAPEFAGVCFTSGPTPKTRDFVVVEAVEGCGESLVSGERTPMHYEVDRDGRTVRTLGMPEPGSPVHTPSGQAVSLVVDTCKAIAAHFGTPQDVEWALAGGELLILQARPITVVGGSKRGAPVGLPSPDAPRGGRPAAARRGAENPMLELRDDLHDWRITQSDPLVFRGASYLLLGQRPDGSWRIEGTPEWDAVSTALMVQLLLRGEIPPNLRWSVPRTGAPTESGLPLAVRWLANNAKPDGTWGSDLWDTCQVIRALAGYGIPAEEPLLRRGLGFVFDQVERGLNASAGQEWFGAGFLAVALRLFTEIKRPDLVANCTEMLLTYQDDDGEFRGPSAADSSTKVPSEWHTAQAISALACVRNPAAAASAIERARKWLEGRQHPNGSWGVQEEPYAHYNTFFTAYSAMALIDSGAKGTDAVTRAFRWLRGRQLASGAFGDLGSSLMAMDALQCLWGPLFSVRLPIPLFLRIQATLSSPSAGPSHSPLGPAGGERG